MLTTKFRVWLQNARIRPDWNGVEFVDSPRYSEDGYLEITVKGNGQDLRQLIATRRIIFSAYLQVKPEKRKEQ